MQRMMKWSALAILLWSAVWLVGCSNQPKDGADIAGLSGEIKIDGSSTVEPITSAVAEEFRRESPNVSVKVGTSGTGGGMKKFIRGEIDIADASRPIEAEEDAECQKNGIEYIEIPVAYDALAVVVNQKNTWCDKLTVAELRKIWEPAAEKKITNWSQVRAGFPNKPLQLFGPGTASGTFDYFTEAVMGKKGECRGDFSPSEDDNVLVQGVQGTEGGLAYFGMAYYEENMGTLKAVPIDDENPDNGEGAIEPTEQNVLNGTYQPLARPLFIYVNVKSLERPEVQAFVKFYLENAATLAKDVKYVPLPETLAPLVKERFEKRVKGSVFGGEGAKVGVKLEDLLKMEERQ